MKRALQRDGWTITHDPFRLDIGEKSLSADLGAERLISAEKGLRKIVVEIKSFVGQSDVHDLEEGRWSLFRSTLQRMREWNGFYGFYGVLSVEFSHPL